MLTQLCQARSARYSANRARPRGRGCDERVRFWHKADITRL